MNKLMGRVKRMVNFSTRKREKFQFDCIQQRFGLLSELVYQSELSPSVLEYFLRELEALQKELNVDSKEACSLFNRIQDVKFFLESCLRDKKTQFKLINKRIELIETTLESETNWGDYALKELEILRVELMVNTLQIPASLMKRIEKSKQSIETSQKKMNLSTCPTPDYWIRENENHEEDYEVCTWRTTKQAEVIDIFHSKEEAQSICDGLNAGYFYSKEHGIECYMEACERQYNS
ncbi:hypothetical protein ABE82_26710 (plasmid) [Paenibacillus peoriae]|uniref:hypothetical protein n=1 Tax=Paenibacillus peoriae TaxID=59893 RepID=UPI00071F3B05|nr:hypothetical protein [Paenibacillus peoriae]ALS10004.1 hypothetical protein ABE82_26710 [Paenibacillus peoriae]